MKNKSTNMPDAFTKSERHAFSGVKLEPWTIERSIAAQSLGLIYPNLSAEDWKSVKRGGIYPGAVRDVMLTIWICTIKKDDVIATELLGIENAMRESATLGAKLRIHNAKNEPFWDALNKCMEMWNEVTDSVTVPVEGKTDDDEDSGNE